MKPISIFFLKWKYKRAKSKLFLIINFFQKKKYINVLILPNIKITKMKLFLNIFLIIFVQQIFSQYVLKISPSDSKILSNHDMDFYKECELKQSYLGVVSNILNNKEAVLKPIFIVLDLKFFSLFENENSSTLIRNIDFQSLEITYNPQKFENLGCFQIMSKSENDYANTKDFFEIRKNIKSSLNYLNNSTMTFCSSEKDAIKSWILSLKKFKTCSKQKKKYSKALKRIDRRKNPPTKSFFDEEQTKNQLDQELQKLKQDVIREKLQEERERSYLENERLKIEKKTRKLEQQQRILSKTLEAKAIEEEKIAEMLIKQEEAYKRNQILETTRKALMNETHKENSLLVSQEQQLLKAEKSLQDQIKNMMVQSSYDFEKLMNFGDCYRKELTGGNSTYIKEVCYKFQESGLKPQAENLVACLDKANFCEQCCNYFIGTSHEAIRFKCRKKCDYVLNPSFNVKTDSAYVLTVPNQNMLPLSNYTQNTTTPSPLFAYNNSISNSSYGNYNYSSYSSSYNTSNNYSTSWNTPSQIISLDYNNKIERDRK